MQNTSHAVMAQRSEPHDSLDDFPTPPWAARALCEHVIGIEAIGKEGTVWEPACNRGFMALGLSDYFKTVFCSDVENYEFTGQHEQVDFLFPTFAERYAEANDVDWIITNPPFRLAQQFIKTSLAIQPYVGVAMLVRTSFLEGVKRYTELFNNMRPSIVAQFAERVPMVKGRCDPQASTATAYAWLVWFNEDTALKTELRWIPPCRKQLERPGDYE